MDVAIPYRMGPKNGVELKYALRSIEKNFQTLGEGEVFLLGEQVPDWFTGGFVAIAQPKEYSQISGVLFKLKMFVDHYAANDFCFTNDDIFFVKPWAGTRYYNQRRSIASRFHNVTVERAKFILEQNGRAMAHDFELHMPIVYNPSQLRTVLNAFDLAIPTALRTLYCNFFPDDHAPTMDCKVMNFMKPEAKWKFFSSDDSWAPRREFLDWLQQTWPHPSRWEKR